jgi:PKD repeat protein
MCVGDTVVLDSKAPVGSSHFWTYNNGWSNDKTIKAYLNSPYALIVQDSNACLNTDTINIDYHPTPTIQNIALANSGPMFSFSAINPVGVTDYKWIFGDGDSSLLQSPVHTYRANGLFGVKLIMSNMCDTDVFNKLIEVTQLETDQLSKNELISISPNPTTGKFTLHFPNICNAYVRVHNAVSGILVSWLNVVSSNKAIIDISDSVSGFYFVTVQIEDKTYQLKLVKQ